MKSTDWGKEEIFIAIIAGISTLSGSAVIAFIIYAAWRQEIGVC